MKKKIFSILIVLMIILLVPACDKGGTSNKESKEYMVELKASPNNGLVWSYTLESDNDIIDVIDDGYLSSQEYSDEGFTGIQKYKIVGLSEGVETITFSPMNFSDNKSFNVSETKYRISIDSNLNVKAELLK